MAITAAMVKELRERTAAGMMDCKKALQEADGDMELAIENMRKNGQAKAAKKAGKSIDFAYLNQNLEALERVSNAMQQRFKDEITQADLD